MCFAHIFPTVEELSDLDYCTASLSKLRGVTFCCLNVRSLTRHYDSIKLMLMRSEIDCLILNETFLNNSISTLELNVPNYNIYRFDRTPASGKTCGGGVLAYVHNKYDFSLIENSELCTPAIESLWFKLELKCTRPTFINAFYRPPDGSTNDFIETLHSQLNQFVDNPIADIIVMGDANIDYNKVSSESRLLKSFLKDKGLTQMISVPTRVTVKSQSVIDHIYINNADLYSHCGVLETGVSDHSLVFTCRNRKKISKEKRTIFIRNYRQFDIEQYNFDIY